MAIGMQNVVTEAPYIPFRIVLVLPVVPGRTQQTSGDNIVEPSPILRRLGVLEWDICRCNLSDTGNIDIWEVFLRYHLQDVSL